MGEINASAIIVILVNTCLFCAAHLNHDKKSANKVVHIQSPIMIKSKNALNITYDDPLTFNGYWDKHGEATLTNNGYSAEVRFSGRKVQPFIRGGPLQGKYVFDQLHFHWDDSDGFGSEHTLDGKIFPMEAHLVHHKMEYRNLNSAMNHSDGCAVVAFFIQDKLNHFNRALQWMRSHGMDKNYYSYHGSLTTKPFSECITWMIYKEPIEVSTNQIGVFRLLLNAENKEIHANHRAIQKNPVNPTVVFVPPN